MDITFNIVVIKDVIVGWLYYGHALRGSQLVIELTADHP